MHHEKGMKYMQSLNTKINKLLKALEIKYKYIYCINRMQFYSERNNRRCTKLVLYRMYKEHPDDKKNKKEEYVFWNPIDVIKFLAEKYKELSEHAQEERNIKEE